MAADQLRYREARSDRLIGGIPELRERALQPRMASQIMSGWLASPEGIPG